MVHAPTGGPRARHWDTIYDATGPHQVSWFQARPTVSLELIGHVPLDPADPVLDAGGGASTLVDRLLERGYTDLTVLDVSGRALALARQRLGEQAHRVHWETADVLDWSPPRQFALWHDRAVFHFLTEPADRARYRQRVAGGIRPGGHLIVATFAADGPDHCSGLPVSRYTVDQLEAELGEAFTAVTTRREHHRTPAGVDQPFTWLLARRTGER